MHQIISIIPTSYQLKRFSKEIIAVIVVGCADFIGKSFIGHIMAGKYQDIEIMLDYSTGRIVKLGEITPEWWIK